jgi:hypothetical protein
MNHLVVDGKLDTLVLDDENADTATAIVEGGGQALEKIALVKDRECLLDVTGLGHGNNTAILGDVENTELLEDRSEHVLDKD